MTATATKYAPANVPGEPPMPIVDINAYEREKAERQAAMDAKRPELLKCLNPAYAARKEMEKPAYRYTVSASWLGPNTENGDSKIAQLESEQVVIARDENEAWSMFCDKIGIYPSRRDAKPVIKRGKQVDANAYAATVNSGSDDPEIPVVKIGPKAKPRR